MQYFINHNRMERRNMSKEVLNIKNDILGLSQQFEELGVDNKIFLKEVSFAMQALGNNAYLASSDKNSILSAVYNLALTGLTLNPALAYAYLVPRKKNKSDAKPVCVLDISYRGLIKLAIDSGGIKSVHSSCVYDKDHFQAQEGTDPFIVHKPDYFSDRGNLTGAYVVATLPDGSKLQTIMSKEEIEKIKAISQFKGEGSIWDLHGPEMYKKTVIKRARKLWPHSDKLANAVQVLNEHEGFEPIQRQLKPDVQMPKALKTEVDYEVDGLPIPTVTHPKPLEAQDSVTGKFMPGTAKEEDIPPQPVPASEEPSETSDKLFMVLKDWEEAVGEKVFQRLLKKHFPKLKYPAEFKVLELETLVEICKEAEKKGQQ